MRLALLLLLLAASPAAAEVYSWTDEQGVLHLSDDPRALPESAREGRAALRGAWETPIDARALLERRSDQSSSAEDRFQRVLRGAVEDLERGESARAVAALTSLLREEPGRAEPHWYLALLDRRRGRFDSAEAHLRAFLSAAGDDLQPLRASAERRLKELEDERRLADPRRELGPIEWRSLEGAGFRLRYDAELGAVSQDYATTVLRYLDEARSRLQRRLGSVPAEPMGVVLYGKAAYLRAHRHRFSFQTVGFFDGRIHVVSAAHPAGELRGLLHHEYTHAVFREQTGGDRPFWLNEGLSEMMERSSMRLEGLTRGERVALKQRIQSERWLPLRRLAPSFSGLDDDDARAAYLEALAAALFVEARTDAATRGRLLRRLGEGVEADEALREAIGLDTEGLDAALRAEILSGFAPLAGSLP